jgi:hypothetical protein
MSDDPLSTFARDRDPSPELQRRVERTLRHRGLLATTRGPWHALGLAASLLLAAGLGFGAGRIRPAPEHGDPGQEFLLLLREDATYHDDRPVGDIVREYSAWADSLRRNDLLLLAEKLGDVHVDVVAPNVAFVPAPQESPTTGFFLVRAPNLEAARAIAAASPHVKYGGRVVIRSVE